MSNAMHLPPRVANETETFRSWAPGEVDDMRCLTFVGMWLRCSARVAQAVLLIVLLTCMLTGCTNGPTAKEREQLQYFAKAYEKAVVTDRFVINPADVITVHAADAKEFDAFKQQIAPDGTINMADPIRRVFVAGMTPKDVEALLQEKIRAIYKDVVVQIDVDYHSEYYYVIGEVNSPGAKRFTGRDTLVQVIADANITRLGWPERVYVLHPSPDKDVRHATVVNMYDILHHGDSTPNVLLAQDDIVYVPLNPLAAIGVAVQNVLFPIQPVIEMTGTARAVGTGGL